MTYNLTNAAYDGKFVSVASETGGDPGVEAVTFKPDGTKMYIVSNGFPEQAYQYALSTPWDVSTAVYESKVGPVNTTVPVGIRFKPDGTRYYVLDADNDNLFQYTMATPWDISTAALTDTLGLGPDGKQEMFFKPNGTKLYVLVSNFYQEYDLASAWDIGTGTHVADSITLTQDGGIRGGDVSDDGTRFFMVGRNTDHVYQYDLSTPWDVTTLTYSGISYDVSGSAGSEPSGMAFSSDGTLMYISAGSFQSVFQYTVGGDTGPWVGFIGVQ